MKKIQLSLACFLAALSFSSAQTNLNLSPREQLIVSAARPDSAPQFHGASLIGIRPGTPFLHALAVTGQKPLKLAVSHLPAGLHFDKNTGIITGQLERAGEYAFSATAKNSAGQAETRLKIVCGEPLALTPPLGWNSYDAFGDSVTAAETLANAAWMQEHLLPLGWDTVVVDFRWYDPQPTGDDLLLNKTRVGAVLAADEFGRLLPASNRFPSATNGAGFKPLASQLHAMGLKFGIHVMRGIPRQAVLAGTPICGGAFTAADAGDPNDKCGWCPDMFGVRNDAAGQAWYDSCAKLWADWGVDYIKVDDLSEPYHAAEIEMIHHAIAKADHSIVFSTSPGPTSTARAGHIAAHANLWRISGDFWDRWPKLNDQFDLLAQWQGAGAPGHWPDADMIPLGQIALRSKMGGPPHRTHFTRDEQLSLLSLWALAPSPLMLGMNLPDNDDWTTALLTNPEVLAINQDASGPPAKRIFKTGQTAEIWLRKLTGGALAVGMFNRTDKTITVNNDWSPEGLAHSTRLRDLWLRQDGGRLENFSAEIPPHGCLLLTVEKY
jgi:hypothetical protein